jgi:hypothetical protein
MGNSKFYLKEKSAEICGKFFSTLNRLRVQESFPQISADF